MWQDVSESEWDQTWWDQVVSQLHSQWHPQDLINYDSIYKIAENFLSTSFWFHHRIFIKWWIWAFYHLVIYLRDVMTNCPDRSQGICNQHPCSMLEPGKKSSQKFSKNKELAHPTSLSTPSGSIGWCTEISERAVMTSTLVRELDLLEWDSWNMLQ